MTLWVLKLCWQQLNCRLDWITYLKCIGALESSLVDSFTLFFVYHTLCSITGTRNFQSSMFAIRSGVSIQIRRTFCTTAAAIFGDITECICFRPTNFFKIRRYLQHTNKKQMSLFLHIQHNKTLVCSKNTIHLQIDNFDNIDCRLHRNTQHQ